MHTQLLLCVRRCWHQAIETQFNSRSQSFFPLLCKWFLFVFFSPDVGAPAYSPTCISRSHRNENSSDTGIITDAPLLRGDLCGSQSTPTQSEALQAKLVGMFELHTFHVDPETDIVITGGRDVVTEIHVSIVTLRLTMMPCWPTDLWRATANPVIRQEQSINFSRYCSVWNQFSYHKNIFCPNIKLTDTHSCSTSPGQSALLINGYTQKVLQGLNLTQETHMPASAPKLFLGASSSVVNTTQGQNLL